MNLFIRRQPAGVPARAGTTTFKRSLLAATVLAAGYGARSFETRSQLEADWRQMVEEATRDGGRALVIPARTTAQGPEREFLEGLDYALGSGFAPHPLFARWVEEQIRNGVSAIENEAIPRNAVAGRPGADGRAQLTQELSHTGANHDGN